MNNSLTKAVALLVMGALMGLLGCGGKSPEQKLQESKLEKLRPREEDRLSTLMDRGWDNLTYMMYGFMNYDNERIKVASANIVTMSPYMDKRIAPVYMKHREEWRDQCDQQQELAGIIRRQFEEKNFEASLTSLRDLVGVCMDCHKVYRMHLIEPEEEWR